MQANLKDAWEASYQRHENYVFYPHEEVIRFVSKYIRKRTDLDAFTPENKGAKVLDLGCGIGRHVIYGTEMGLSMYGIDLAQSAIETSHHWLDVCGMEEVKSRTLQGNITQLPWDNSTFDYALSHGVLDSLPLEDAKRGILELARVMKPGGLFYCDCVGSDRTGADASESEEVIVTSQHEQNTVQRYFSEDVLKNLFEPEFEIVECVSIKRQDVLSQQYFTRWHVVVRKNA